jgi:hypothetical protein
VSDHPAFSICDDSNNDTACYNAYTQNIIIQGVKDWHYYEVLFSDLEIDPTWGLQQSAFNVENITGIRFLIDDYTRLCLKRIFIFSEPEPRRGAPIPAQGSALG